MGPKPLHTHVFGPHVELNLEALQLKWGADEVRQHESSGLFLAFHILAFHKKLDKDFFVRLLPVFRALVFGLALCFGESINLT